MQKHSRLLLFFVRKYLLIAGMPAFKEKKTAAPKDTLRRGHFMPLCRYNRMMRTFYSVRKAMTGSFLAAARAGNSPETMVRTKETQIMTIACHHGRDTSE